MMLSLHLYRESTRDELTWVDRTQKTEGHPISVIIIGETTNPTTDPTNIPIRCQAPKAFSNPVAGDAVSSLPLPLYTKESALERSLGGTHLHKSAFIDGIATPSPTPIAARQKSSGARPICRSTNRLVTLRSCITRSTNS
eukprot:scaffold307_cov390-Prasinococcus_capsulatus_cf.AAC.5